MKLFKSILLILISQPLMAGSSSGGGGLNNSLVSGDASHRVLASTPRVIQSIDTARDSFMEDFQGENCLIKMPVIQGQCHPSGGPIEVKLEFTPNNNPQSKVLLENSQEINCLNGHFSYRLESQILHFPGKPQVSIMQDNQSLAFNYSEEHLLSATQLCGPWNSIEYINNEPVEQSFYTNKTSFIASGLTTSHHRPGKMDKPVRLLFQVLKKEGQLWNSVFKSPEITNPSAWAAELWWQSPGINLAEHGDVYSLNIVSFAQDKNNKWEVYGNSVVKYIYVDREISVALGTNHQIKGHDILSGTCSDSGREVLIKVLSEGQTKEFSSLCQANNTWSEKISVGDFISPGESFQVQLAHTDLAGNQSNFEETYHLSRLAFSLGDFDLEDGDSAQRAFSFSGSCSEKNAQVSVSFKNRHGNGVGGDIATECMHSSSGARFSFASLVIPTNILSGEGFQLEITSQLDGVENETAISLSAANDPYIVILEPSPSQVLSGAFPEVRGLCNGGDFVSLSGFSLLSNDDLPLIPCVDGEFSYQAGFNAFGSGANAMKLNGVNEGDFGTRNITAAFTNPSPYSTEISYAYSICPKAYHYMSQVMTYRTLKWDNASKSVNEEGASDPNGEFCLITNYDNLASSWSNGLARFASDIKSPHASNRHPVKKAGVAGFVYEGTDITYNMDIADPHITPITHDDETWFYMTGTSNAHRYVNGLRMPKSPLIFKSKDLVSWEFHMSVFNDEDFLTSDLIRFGNNHQIAAPWDAKLYIHPANPNQVYLTLSAIDCGKVGQDTNGICDMESLSAGEKFRKTQTSDGKFSLDNNRSVYALYMNLNDFKQSAPTKYFNPNLMYFGYLSDPNNNESYTYDGGVRAQKLIPSSVNAYQTLGARPQVIYGEEVGEKDNSLAHKFGAYTHRSTTLDLAGAYFFDPEKKSTHLVYTDNIGVYGPHSGQFDRTGNRVFSHPLVNFAGITPASMVLFDTWRNPSDFSLLAFRKNTSVDVKTFDQGGNQLGEQASLGCSFKKADGSLGAHPNNFCVSEGGHVYHHFDKEHGNSCYLFTYSAAATWKSSVYNMYYRSAADYKALFFGPLYNSHGAAEPNRTNAHPSKIAKQLTFNTEHSEAQNQQGPQMGGGHIFKAWNKPYLVAHAKLRNEATRLPVIKELDIKCSASCDCDISPVGNMGGSPLPQEIVNLNIIPNSRFSGLGNEAMDTQENNIRYLKIPRPGY